MPMQYDWDWTRDYATKEKIEGDLIRKFAGPGLYLTATYTVLIIPIHDSIEPRTIWNHEQPEDAIWRVFVWNCSFDSTALSAPIPPTRIDER